MGTKESGSTRVADESAGAIVADNSLHIADTANVAYLKIAQGHVENNGTVDLVYATSTNVTFTNNGSVDHAHTISEGAATTLNNASVTTGLKYDYNQNELQNDDADVYHHVTVGTAVAGEHAADGTTTWAEGKVDTAAQGVVNNAIAQEIEGDFWIGVAADSFASGTGSKDDPYLISDGTQLARIAKLVNDSKTNTTYSNSNVYYKLNNDIELSSKAWTPIGLNRYEFKAKFDGNGKTIYGLTNKGHDGDDLSMIYGTLSSGQTGAKAYGLFGWTEDAIIENVTLSDTKIDGDFQESGALVGKVNGTDSITFITNCDIVKGKESYVIGQSKIGSFVGTVNSSAAKLNDCNNYIDITANDSGSYVRAGGIIGSINSENANNTTEIYKCSNSGKITAKDYAGGMVGHLYGGDTGATSQTTKLIVVNSLNSGEVSATYRSECVSFMATTYFNLVNFKIGKTENGTYSEKTSESYSVASDKITDNNGYVICGTASVETDKDGVQSCAHLNAARVISGTFDFDVTPYVIGHGTVTETTTTNTFSRTHFGTYDSGKPVYAVCTIKASDTNADGVNDLWTVTYTLSN